MTNQKRWEDIPDARRGAEPGAVGPQANQTKPRYRSLLDCLLSSDAALVTDCQVREPFSTSDHLAVAATIALAVPEDLPEPKRNWHKADWEGMQIYLAGIHDEQWAALSAESATVEEFSTAVYASLEEAVNQYVPVSRRKPAAATKTKLPEFLLRLKRRKHRSAKKGLNSSQAKKAARLFKTAVRRHARRTERRKIREQGRSRAVHSLFRAKTKPRAPIPTLQTEHGPATSDEDLSRQFEKAYIDRPCQPESAPFGPQPRPPPRLHDVPTEPFQVHKTLQRLGTKLSVGPDGLHLLLYKRCATQLAVPLRNGKTGHP